MNFQMFKLVFEKAEEPEIKLPTSAGSSKKQEFQKNIYFWFIDYAKAFDCVDHNKLWKILKETGIPDHLTCLLRNLYAGQEAKARTGHGTTDWVQIGKGVRQGCILSPCLFNSYAEYIMRNAGLEEEQAGIPDRVQIPGPSLSGCVTSGKPLVLWASRSPSISGCNISISPHGGGIIPNWHSVHGVLGWPKEASGFHNRSHNFLLWPARWHCAGLCSSYGRPLLPRKQDLPLSIQPPEGSHPGGGSGWVWATGEVRSLTQWWF